MIQANVLIIDDDKLNVDILTRLLEPLNTAVTTVLEPDKLESIIDDLPVLDVVFLDLEMPALDGYEVLVDLKERYGITAPVVAYTVHTSESPTAAKLGFDSFLAKPLDADQFPDLFERILKGERVWHVRW